MRITRLAQAAFNLGDLPEKLADMVQKAMIRRLVEEDARLGGKPSPVSRLAHMPSRKWFEATWPDGCLLFSHDLSETLDSITLGKPGLQERREWFEKKISRVMPSASKIDVLWKTSPTDEWRGASGFGTNTGTMRKPEHRFRITIKAPPTAYLGGHAAREHMAALMEHELQHLVRKLMAAEQNMGRDDVQWDSYQSLPATQDTGTEKPAWSQYYGQPKEVQAYAAQAARHHIIALIREAVKFPPEERVARLRHAAGDIELRKDHALSEARKYFLHAPEKAGDFVRAYLRNLDRMVEYATARLEAQQAGPMPPKAASSDYGIIVLGNYDSSYDELRKELNVAGRTLYMQLEMGLPTDPNLEAKIRRPFTPRTDRIELNHDGLNHPVKRYIERVIIKGMEQRFQHLPESEAQKKRAELMASVYGNPKRQNEVRHEILELVRQATPTTIPLGNLLNKLYAHNYVPTLYLTSGKWAMVIELIPGGKQIMRTFYPTDYLMAPPPQKPSSTDSKTIPMEATPSDPKTIPLNKPEDQKVASSDYDIVVLADARQ